MADILRIENLSGGYGLHDIVTDISLTVREGDFLGLIGPNGSGKTTLLRLATRILHGRKGRILFRENDIYRMPLKEFCQQVAFVSQDIGTNFSFTVMEIVLMGRIPHLKRLQAETRRDRDIARDALSETDSLHLKDKLIDELSAGERQRVIIARAIAQQPRLLFLDEPTSYLDIGHQIQTLDLLKKLNRTQGLTIVMVQHDLNLASSYCDRIALLDTGKIFKYGAPEDVLTYRNIESVYKTVVLVNENPLTKKPNIVLVPGDKLCAQRSI
ncbi:MAG TPA: ABC transporter ATP-binding protein [Candidatus Omnitrophota bacterium]|nr:ABC transporter ATP-binding protein [Candidatus Omnitrophota bacterium]